LVEFEVITNRNMVTCYYIQLLGNIMKEMECGLNQERTCTTNQQGNIDY